MNPSSKAALNAYANLTLETEVMAASPHRLILMLFDGALKSILIAKSNLQAGNIPHKGAAISKAIAIVDGGLRAGLDKSVGGDLADQLDRLYEYICYLLLQANLQNKVDMLDEAASLLNDLRDSWETIGKVPVADSPEQPDGQPRPAASYGRV